MNISSMEQIVASESSLAGDETLIRVRFAWLNTIHADGGNVGQQLWIPGYLLYAGQDFLARKW